MRRKPSVLEHLIYERHGSPPNHHLKMLPINERSNHDTDPLFPEKVIFQDHSSEPL
jgi:hypothetical protein